MNERIKELAEQAGFVTNEIKSYVISPYTSEDQNLYEELEAFAKLIAEKAIKEALAQQAVVEHDLAAAYRTELDKLSQRNYELRMENAQLKAQPKEQEQEPVGSLSVRYHRGCKSMTNTDFDYNGDLPEGDYELYTTPPQRTWVGLTDREIDKLWTSLHDDFGNPPSATGYERDIEAKLKQKNGYAEEKNTRGQE